MIDINEMNLFFKLFNDRGYVLDFSTYKFDEFTEKSIGEALCQKYDLSKGKSLECYCTHGSPNKVIKLLSDLMKYYEDYYLISNVCPNQKLLERCKEVLEREKKELNNQAPTTTNLSNGDIKVFSKQLKFIKELGAGATGGTYLFEDTNAGRKVAVKKLEPLTKETPEESFKRFQYEAFLLSQTYHQNIVKMFDYYLYPKAKIGYILMEYIDGDPIGTVPPSKYGKTWEDIFCQTIDGFVHLEQHKITHRDIREDNILINHEGTVKIIDFGFGKQIRDEEDSSKSISLRRSTLECPEEEQLDNQYTEMTDIFYLGKLFDRVIPEQAMSSFAYKSIVEKMCKRELRNCHKSI